MLLSVIRHDWLEILINSYLKVEFPSFDCIIEEINHKRSMMFISGFGFMMDYYAKYFAHRPRCSAVIRHGG
jgi:hypothetical protein